MLLDEPTSFLDIRHQMEILELVGRLNRDQGLTVVMALLEHPPVGRTPALRW